MERTSIACRITITAFRWRWSNFRENFEIKTIQPRMNTDILFVDRFVCGKFRMFWQETERRRKKQTKVLTVSKNAKTPLNKVMTSSQRRIYQKSNKYCDKFICFNEDNRMRERVNKWREKSLLVLKNVFNGNVKSMTKITAHDWNCGKVLPNDIQKIIGHEPNGMLSVSIFQQIFTQDSAHNLRTIRNIRAQSGFFPLGWEASDVVNLGKKFWKQNTNEKNQSLELNKALSFNTTKGGDCWTQTHNKSPKCRQQTIKSYRNPICSCEN